MRKINKPQYSLEDIIKDCYTSYIDESKKKKFNKCVGFIVGKSNTYDDLAIKNKLCNIVPHNIVNGILTKQDMCNLYSYKFVAHQDVRPKYYDKIMVLSSGKCPICGVGQVSNLDHYLPKSLYPTYAVTPFNLIPICFDCNKNKKNTKIQDFRNTPFHPYYESIDDIYWLEAKLEIREGSIVTQYYINDNIKTANVDLYYRLDNHFKLYKLNKKFSLWAGSEITDKREMWIDDYHHHGEERVLQSLKRELSYLEKKQQNTWKTALYRALINDINVLNKS